MKQWISLLHFKGGGSLVEFVIAKLSFRPRQNCPGQLSQDDTGKKKATWRDRGDQVAEGGYFDLEQVRGQLGSHVTSKQFAFNSQHSSGGAKNRPNGFLGSLIQTS